MVTKEKCDEIESVGLMIQNIVDNFPQRGVDVKISLWDAVSLTYCVSIGNHRDEVLAVGYGKTIGEALYAVWSGSLLS
jgi:hypothetical protein